MTLLVRQHISECQNHEIETLNMTLDKIKKAFVAYMEETRRGDPYPRNFMGCLTAILVEPKPASQERIMELTRFSQTTVSLTLQKLQLLMPIKLVKERGDRKKYYTYDGSPDSFILDLWQKRLEVQGTDIVQIEATIDEIKERVGNNKSLRRFLDYLYNMQLYTTLIHSLRASSIRQYRSIVQPDSNGDTESQDNDVLEIFEVENFLEELRKNQPDLESVADSEPKYLQMKNDYFSALKANLNPLYSQTIANQIMVLHDVFIDQVTTQVQIEKSTLLPRSTISELLSEFVRMGVIRVTKREGTKIKLYQPAISFTDFMLGYSNRLGRQMITAKENLSEFILATRKVSTHNTDTKFLINILESFLQAYSFTEEFTKNFKARMVTRLKQACDSGFVLI